MRWVWMVLAALVLLLAEPAYAQSIPTPPAAKPSAADDATAKRNFESGLKLYGEGAYPEALIAFEQSYRLGGRASALKNIAQCHRNLKHFVEAHEAYEQMLALHDAQLSPPDKKAVQQALEELALLTGTVLVEVNEPGADIEIDGRSAGRSPMTKPKRVSVSPHVVRVTKATFAPFEQSVSVGSQDQKKIDVKLAPEKTTAHVSVREQSGRDVHVFVDTRDVGPAPWEGEIESGEHTIEAKGQRFASEARKVHLAAKERSEITFDAAPLLGRLRVTTVPATATITIDGKILGTGAWEGDLPEGTHRIEVAVGGQAAQVRDVTIGRGQLVVQEIPVIAAIALAPPAEYAGMYVKVSLGAMLAAAGRASNESSTVIHEGSFVGQAGAALRVGRAWDWYGAEVVGMFMFEHREENLQSNIAGTDSHFKDQSDAVNVFLGVGPRATSKDESIRFTFGIAPGIAIRTFNPRRTLDSTGGPPNNSQPTANRFVQATTNSGPINSNQGDQSYAGAGYTSLGFLMDGGILIGSTPGTKFFLGVQAWLDFAPTLVTGPDTIVPLPDSAYTRPGRGITLVEGAQFYLGPVLGLQFGH